MDETPKPDLNPLLEIANQYDLDDRDRLLLAYRTGAKGNLTLQQLGDHLKITRERVRQLENRVKERIGQENWDKLEGIYRPPIPLAVSERALKAQRTKIRKYFKSVKPSENIQFGSIMDALGIQFEHISDAYEQDETESCLTFFELYGITDFGRLKLCRACHQVKSVSEDPEASEFYKIGGTDRFSGRCKKCNTERCHDYVERNREKINNKRREWLLRKAEQ